MKSCWIGLGVLAVLLLVMGGCGVSSYNGLVAKQERVAAAGVEIANQYKRRYDLVPQLVEVVKGAADFEQTTIENVTKARAEVGRVQLPEGLPSDPAALERYVQAQRGLGSALGRLFAVAENYPQLKATQNFVSLQDQIEGTENRIAVARRDHIDAVRDYNTARRRIPANLIAAVAGFEPATPLSFDEENLETAPEIDFGQR